MKVKNKPFCRAFIAVLLGTISASSVCIHAEENEDLPFLKSPYLYEYRNERKSIMNGNVAGETISETTYDDNNRINSIVTTMNGQKMLELIDYAYGDRTRNYTVNNYMNGQLSMTSTVSDTFGDDIYRNMLVSETETDMGGVKSVTRYEWTYDDEGRIIGMKEFENGELQMEQKEYVWTPNSCEYVEDRIAPFPSVSKVSKQFKDDQYVQNILEIHSTEMNGMKSETRSEFDYDDDGNIISSKQYMNGALSTEWKDYNWGDKKCTHIEIMYMNGTPMSTTEVTQYYK